mgnify:CR=1 FL=1
MGVLCVDCVREANRAAPALKSRLGFKAALGTPWVTYSLMAASILTYVVGSALLGRDWQWYLGMWPQWTPEWGAFYPESGEQWYRWITSGFVHFGFLHLGLNMFVLWQFGTQLEPALGRARFLALYVGSLLGSSLVVYLLGSEGSVHGGASGAIFGVIAAFAIVLRKLKLQWANMAAFAGIWLVMGFFATGLSWQGHLGGAVAGALIMWAMLRSVDRHENTAV